MKKLPSQPGTEISRRDLLTLATRSAVSAPFVALIAAACSLDSGDTAPTEIGMEEPASPTNFAHSSTLEATATPVLVESTVTTTTPNSTSVPTQTSEVSRTPTVVQIDPELLAEITELAIPFDTAEPDSGLADLEPFREIVGGSQIVALGETTHGTSEFFKMKHRIIEFLVTEMGFTLFAMEAPWPRASIANDFVQGEDISKDDVISALTFNAWRNEEVWNLMEWLRSYNESRGDAPAVQFHGFDIQVLGDEFAITEVTDSLKSVDPAVAGDFAAHFDGFNNVDETTAESLQRAIEVHDYLVGKREEYLSLVGEAAVDRNIRIALSMVQHQEARLSENYNAIRDQYMYEQTNWILDQNATDSRVVLWAHNLHVGTTGRVLGVGPTERPMGALLKEQYGDDVLTVGFDFGAGTFNARSIVDLQSSEFGPYEEQHIPAPKRGSYEHAFQAIDLPRMILDLRQITPDSVLGSWAGQTRSMWMVGAVFDERYPGYSIFPVILTDQFDVLIYFQQTTASDLLPGPAERS